MRVIFWDVDGVLNHPRVWGAWTKVGRVGALDPVIVERAARLTRAARAKCVLSSTWRFAGLKRTVEALIERGWVSAREDFIDTTPCLDAIRGIEIGTWLVEHPEVTSFVIIDDDADMGPHLHRLVQTDYNHGMTDADYARAIALFNGEAHAS